jgi:hypothetical protein
MSVLTRIGPHIVLAIVAAFLAVWTWTAEETSASAKAETIEVWGGEPAQISNIQFVGERLAVDLKPATDRVGRYYVGKVVRTVEKRTPPPEDDPDAEPVVETSEKVEEFIAVTAGDKLTGRLVPLVADRKIGALSEERAKEFGFEDNNGTLELALGDGVKALTFGGVTPGGADRYVRTEGGQVYAVTGVILRDLKGGAPRLQQRRLHDWKLPDVAKVQISANGKTRELVPVEGKKSFWADADSPDAANETASNWMTKLARVQATKYTGAATRPDESSTPAFRVDFFDEAGAPVGYTEVAPGPPNDKGDPTYLIRSELTRWWAQTPKSVEGLVEDAKSVVE